MPTPVIVTKCTPITLDVLDNLLTAFRTIDAASGKFVGTVTVWDELRENEFTFGVGYDEDFGQTITVS